MGWASPPALPRRHAAQAGPPSAGGWASHQPDVPQGALERAYWWQGTPYTLTPAEQHEALGLGREVARRLDVPFLVVDVAQEVSGRWIVIECNDGQESGYAGISPFALWQAILDVERETGAS
ncbi:ATP-grasp domain-containing protein [Myxococcus vastator]|uniref:ATP-grasp domain-containing protein n=1 Tax=Myxococcus vastator TaxID=2709664 RepID=UPI0023DDC28B|nr:ATP-grasp domain-containing protein [Myxococcus vastator]